MPPCLRALLIPRIVCSCFSGFLAGWPGGGDDCSAVGCENPSLRVSVSLSPASARRGGSTRPLWIQKMALGTWKILPKNEKTSKKPLLFKNNPQTHPPSKLGPKAAGFFLRLRRRLRQPLSLSLSLSLSGELEGGRENPPITTSRTGAVRFQRPQA